MCRLNGELIQNPYALPVIQVVDLDDCEFDYEVYPESVAQFVGYDKNGAEIYSDDKIRVYDKGIYGVAIAGECFKVNEIGKKFDNVELINEEVKKNVQNFSE